ncbi:MULTISPECIES: hypothetical protein [unclassified Variovorax]|uniref:hypothetical protein n=1 Tax=unclassified Variovorax TaxID=663243 RepID=UPI00076CA05E|nr:MULTISPECIES: hypothetical protein [unclassified Variovorax]KWT72568.1 hypothetical protein APY03_6127 [Variovorax sp. WDL1]PNG58445.1 hypothetical protein CHC07_00170 [Variovorax sp. B4]PNG61765.1 hypothetical protein CHC06_01666 [Variovorax sp. B2]VTV12177.1 hypothetical protein WDL1CHR_02999 [Variovorax sp. WDL1]
MPIATPPPDFDPTIVPPSPRQPSQSEAWETGIATDPPAKADVPVSDAKRLTDLVKLWPQDRAHALMALNRLEVAGKEAA